MAYKKGDVLSEINARKTNSKLKPDGYVYILKLKGHEDIYKIGVSANLKRRIKDIDSANPFGIDLMYFEWFKNVYNLEECIHHSFSNCLLRKEWFKISIEEINQLIKDIKVLSDQGVYLNKR